MSSPMLKCGVCEKQQMKTRFSNTAIKKYEKSLRVAKVRRNDSLIEPPRCRTCTGEPVQELKCAHCGYYQSLDKFSGNMRRDPDNALCWPCSQTVQDIEPIHTDQVEEEAVMDRLRTGATATDLLTGSTALGRQARSRASETSSVVSGDICLDGASDWISPPVPIPNDPRAGLTGASSHPSISPVMSTVSGNLGALSNTTWGNLAPAHASYRNSSGSTGSQGKNSRFVKQGAVKQDLVFKAQSAYQRELNSAQLAEEQADRHEDSGSDDDDSEDPY